MTRAFFIVGPTATGKSELAADVAREIGAEIVSADAFQIYRGLDLLSAKPDLSTLAKAPHHLIGEIPFSEEMNAEKYRRAAIRVVAEINSRGRLAGLNPKELQETVIAYEPVWAIGTGRNATPRSSAGSARFRSPHLERNG